MPDDSAESYVARLKEVGRYKSHTDLLEAKATVVEWLPPKHRKEFMGALEADAKARIATCGVPSEEAIKAMESIVLPQAERLYDEVLHKSGKAELMELCEKLGLDPTLADGRTTKSLLVLILSVVRVLPISQ